MLFGRSNRTGHMEVVVDTIIFYLILAFPAFSSVIQVVSFWNILDSLIFLTRKTRSNDLTPHTSRRGFILALVHKIYCIPALYEMPCPTIVASIIEF